MDIIVPTGETVRTDHDDTATVRPQAGNNASGVRPLRARKRRNNPGSDYLSDALALLGGWTRDGVQLRRDLACDDSQHAALTERIKVAADTLSIRPMIRRVDGHTQICLGDRDGEAITDGEVTLAARIEDFYRTVLDHS